MSIPVFLNGVSVAAAEGATLATLIRDHAPELIPALLDGTVIASDGRAISVPFDTPVYAGAIFIVKISARGIQV